MAALIAIVFTVATAQAQAPQLMSFQSVVRDSTGKLVANHSVGLRLSILQGSIAGTAVYTETQTATSNANGLITLQVGGGTVVSGTFSSIDWSAGPYYINSEIDPTGGTNYAITGTTQLLSVAYAMYANKAGTASSASNVSQGVKIGFSSSTTWICPAGVNQITVECWGGAGGGGGSSFVGAIFSNASPRGFWHGGNFNIVGSGNAIQQYQGMGVLFKITNGGGGNGGTGGYIKQTINVVPGTSYSIMIGTGGAGGGGGNINNYNGLNGSNGNSTSFNNNIIADGGTAGTGGQVTVGPTGSWDDVFLNNQGGGSATNGISGISANVINFSYPTTNYGGGTRSYLPTAIITPIPSSSAAIGQGGGINSGNSGIWDQTNGINGYSGSNGEDGYCLISY